MQTAKSNNCLNDLKKKKEKKNASDTNVRA